MMIQRIILLIVASLYIQVAIASKEGVLPFSEFHIKSEGIGESGAIVVTGKKDKEDNFISLSVEAFGKIISIPPEILLEIPSKNQNGIQLSYEAGYRSLGGKTVYLQFQVGFTSGLQKVFIISASENGNVKILEQ